MENGGFDIGSLGGILQMLGPMVGGYGAGKGNMPMAAMGLLPLLMRGMGGGMGQKPWGSMVGSIGAPPTQTPNISPGMQIGGMPQYQMQPMGGVLGFRPRGF